MTSGPKRVGPGGAPRRTKINIRELDVRERSAVGIFPGIKFSQRSIRNLSRFQDTQLHGLHNMVDRLVAGNIPVAGIIVNTSENFPIFSSLDEYQSHVTVDILRDCLTGTQRNVIDLNKLSGRLLRQTLASRREVTPPGGTSRPEETPAGKFLTALIRAKSSFYEYANSEGAEIQGVFDLLDRMKENLGFKNAVIFYESPETVNQMLRKEERRWIRGSVTRVWAGGQSKYDPATGGSVPDTTLKSVIEGPETLYMVNIEDPASFTKAGLIADPVSIENDRKCSRGDSGMLFIKLVANSGEVLGVVQIHNRIGISEEGNPEPLLPDCTPQFQETLKSALVDYFDKAAKAIDIICARHASAATAPNASPEAAAHPDPDANAAELYKIVGSKVIFRKYGIFQVARVTNPTVGFTAEEKDVLADALNWHGRSREDMRKHLAEVTELIMVFHEGKPVAFGTANEYDFNNGGTQEKLLIMVGTMTRPNYYGYGMQTLVNGLFMISRWWQAKKGFHLFSSPFAMMRTRSVVVAAGYMRHFSRVVFERLTGKELARANEFSKYMGCQNDAGGVVWRAYEQPVSDTDRDAEVLKGLEKKDPKLAEKIQQAFKDLSPLDARIFQGILTIVDIVKFWFYINVLYRIKNRALKT